MARDHRQHDHRGQGASSTTDHDGNGFQVFNIAASIQVTMTGHDRAGRPAAVDGLLGHAVLPLPAETGNNGGAIVNAGR